MRLFKFKNFEFNRGLRPSYRSPLRALLVLFVGEALAANAFFHQSGWALRPCKLGKQLGAFLQFVKTGLVGVARLAGVDD